MEEQEDGALHGQAIPNMPENENVQVQRADDTQSPQGYCVMCPMPGNILQIMVKEGDRVEKGDDLLVLEAMKMENDIASEVSGTVHRIFVHQGDIVMEGAPMVEII